MFQVTSIIVVLFFIPGWISVLYGVEVDVAVPCNKTCLHGGHCVITPDSSCLGSGFKQICNCPPSYTGEFCENFLIKVECDKICENGGRCVVNFTNEGCKSFLTTCVCPLNYYGDLCETFRADPICDPPCTAGQGECVVLRNSQLAPHLTDGTYCNCSMSATRYHYGNQCQHLQQKGTCNPPCRNGGECNYKGRCICPQRPNSDSPYESFEGCREFDPVCNPGCQNGGTCFRGICECVITEQGYYNGPVCEQFIEKICNPACQNGGTCRRGFCRCKQNNLWEYYGSACEQFQDYRRCSPPCEDDSVCQYSFCRCISNASQYISGSGCSNVIECVGGCLNGGTCDYGGKCRCLKEYTGFNCETYTGCPCLNNGRCVDDECHCVANETGTFNEDLCSNFIFHYPCYPPVLNGGLCSGGNIFCLYDDVGYFHGDQCEKYSLKNCGSSCLEPEVCLEEGCICPYNLTERHFTYTNDNGRCKGQYYL
ncbi:fibropellin-1 isoform X2 [Patella vulgata]|nr:fibropellin-1 isoform X2 [Patella vulgata]